jgi:hypothetical protein
MPSCPQQAPLTPPPTHTLAHTHTKAATRPLENTHATHRRSSLRPLAAAAQLAAAPQQRVQGRSEWRQRRHCGCARGRGRCRALPGTGSSSRWIWCKLTRQGSRCPPSSVFVSVRVRGGRVCARAGRGAVGGRGVVSCVEMRHAGRATARDSLEQAACTPRPAPVAHHHLGAPGACRRTGRTASGAARSLRCKHGRASSSSSSSGGQGASAAVIHR